jgi:hypothetical protein
VTRGRELRGVSTTADLVLVDVREGPDGPPALLPVPGPGRRTLVERLHEEARGAGATGPATLVGGPRATASSELRTRRATGAAAVLDALAELAEARPDEALLVLPAELVVDRVALLDLLDHPARRSAAFVVTGPSDPPAPEGIAVRRHGSPARVASVGTAVHAVTAPDATALGVLRVDPRDRAAAGRLWREAADLARRHGWDADGVDPLALALLALTRGDVPVAAVPFGRYPWARPADAAELERALAAVEDVDPWRLRLAQASRPDDGFYSTFAVRPVSRRITGLLLPTGARPNVVTLVSLAIGVGGALVLLAGDYWAFVVAAVALQVSLAVDCVDGEIARYTRRFSAFGAWLDATGDRVKEYAVYAALAVITTTAERDLWPLAATVMVVVSYRHFADYAYNDLVRAASVPKAYVAPLDQRHDGGTANRGMATELGVPTRREGALHWARKVVHLPIGERNLAISLSLLSGSGPVVLWTMLVLSLVSIAYTTGGRALRTVLGRTPYTPLLVDGWGHLDHETDLGPLARDVGGRVRLPFAAVWLCLLAPLAAAALARASDVPAALPVALVLLAGLGLGACLRPPVTARLMWVVPGFLWVVESAFVLAIADQHAPERGGVVFGLLAALAYHRYDAIYRMRDTGRPPGRAVHLLALGVEGRLLLLAAVAALAPDAVGGVLVALVAWLVLVYAVESSVSWTRWIRRQRLAAA